MDAYTAAWVFWLLMFAGIEGAALANAKVGDTLSEHLWRWFSLKEKGTGWRVRRFSLLAFFAWLVAHILTGGEF